LWRREGWIASSRLTEKQQSFSPSTPDIEIIILKIYAYAREFLRQKTRVKTNIDNNRRGDMLHRTFTFSRNTSKRHTPQNIQTDKHAKLGGYVTATIQLHLQAGQDLLWIRRIRIRSGVAASAVVPELPAPISAGDSPPGQGGRLLGLPGSDPGDLAVGMGSDGWMDANRIYLLTCTDV
jgi:hypothetical protein